ncbi:MAG: bifunctional phosphoribosylaminoimidazolecarboxamide formyltransferase/IMP cyclohydrolase [Chlamydiota bacterium]|nr:bifunctional phosphoribosylaminoimidazolecarboxamide formyltransferase/IMP cyclohydrolase [Chlamydiota bacterium]
MISIKRALISVSDKTGLVEFARELSNLGIEIISTGGTTRILKDADIPVTLISDYTGFPEILDGRVKTLHPKVHGALLGLRDDPSHIAQMREHQIVTIDMVVVNLYPFEETRKMEDASHEDIIENIDIGGPSMLRSASKNYRFVAVVVNPNKYELVINEMKSHDGTLSEAFRLRLAKEAFTLTARYDLAISNYLEDLSRPDTLHFPSEIGFAYKKVDDLRYGENPHQKGAFYAEFDPHQASLFHAKKLSGKALSFNNIYDLNAGCTLAMEFDEPCSVIIKHANPCGVAVANTIEESFAKAWSADSLSAFGGILVFNRPVEALLAETISNNFVEAVIAPSVSNDALDILKKKKNLIVLELKALQNKLDPKSEHFLDFKRVLGGLLIQESDLVDVNLNDIKVVSKTQPSNEQLKHLMFAWKVAKHVKSNAIVIARDQETVGIGAGQMSRVDAVEFALLKARSSTKDCVLASDAFFPFRDSIDKLAEAGIRAVIQPGGSVRDQEVIDAVNEHNIAMVFTGMRHFKH